MGALISLIALFILISVVIIGVGSFGLQYLFGVVLPYTAIIIFVFGVVLRVVKWSRSPVPFRITTTCGQQKSLPWIKADNLESPSNLPGVVGRMALEVLFFRSLFRNRWAQNNLGGR
jgi:nitrate reductase gamma subunit